MRVPGFFVCWLVFSLFAASSCGRAAPFRIVAYLPDYRVPSVDPHVLGSVTDCVFFSLEPTPMGGIDSRRLTPALAARLHEMQLQTHIPFLVTLGGWERSSGFAPVATDAAKRRRFAQALTQFCLQRGFAGADFDWEHPANAAEEAGYAALLIETRRAFAPHGLRLSVTLAPWQHLDVRAVAAVEEVNLMSYDHDGRHSTLAQAQADTAGLLQQGIPAEKICLGIPFYGRGIAKGDQTQTYAEIVQQYHPRPEVDEVNGLYFNGIATVQAKTQYARRQHLGGVMVWELGQDTTDSTSLLQAIHAAVSKK